MMPKNTALLIVGATGASWKRHEDAIRRGLLGLDREWVFESSSAPTISDAIAAIPALQRLEIVLLTGDFGLNADALAEGCADLAKAIHAHPNHPWVTFAAPELERLGPIFEAGNVLVECGMAQYVIHERWASQVRSAA